MTEVTTHQPEDPVLASYRDKVIKDVLLHGLKADPSTCNEPELRFVILVWGWTNLILVNMTSYVIKANFVPKPSPITKNLKNRPMETLQKRTLKIPPPQHGRSRPPRHRINSTRTGKRL